MLVRPPLLSKKEADELDARDHEVNRGLYAQGKKLAYARQPCIRVPGPLPLLTVLPARPSQHHALGAGRNYNT
eukprot:4084913-Karenia_brevis.AAC.1